MDVLPMTDTDYPYAYLDQLASAVSRTSDAHIVMRMMNEIGLAICQRLDRLIALQEHPPSSAASERVADD